MRPPPWRWRPWPSSGATCAEANRLLVKVTIVTPSFNQAPFLERALESVAAQRGPFELEHLVVDGGSTDGSLEILRRREGRMRWSSGPDRGQSDAINRGLRQAGGELLAWLNSDDTYEPGAVAAAVAAAEAGARWCYGQVRVVDEGDREVRRAVTAYRNRQSRRFSLARLLGGNFIPQPAVFFRRGLLDEVGLLDEALHYAMDYDLWLRFARVAEPAFLPRDLACFRWHAASKTGSNYRASAREALAIARRHAGGGHRAALLHHRLHAGAMVATYGLWDLVSPAPSARP